MKKGIFLTLAAALMMCFAACNPEENNGGSDDNNYSTLIVGTWRIDNMIVDGDIMTPQNMQFTFEANGRGLMNDNGVTEHNGFSWSIHGSNITINPDYDDEATFSITSLTATECSFSGNVVPGTDMEASVNIHMVKVNPGPNPGPGPDPAVFPVGTSWLYEGVFTDTIEDERKMSYEISIKLMVQFTADTLGTATVQMFATMGDMVIPGSEFTETMPFTYTFDATTNSGVFYIDDVDEESGVPFTEATDFHFNDTRTNLIIVNTDTDPENPFESEIIFNPMNK